MKVIEKVFSLENPNGIEREIEVPENDEVKTRQEEMAEKQAIKDSAKAKLIAGEPLTEEEANVMIGG